MGGGLRRGKPRFQAGTEAVRPTGFTLFWPSKFVLLIYYMCM